LNNKQRGIAIRVAVSTSSPKLLQITAPPHILILVNI